MISVPSCPVALPFDKEQIKNPSQSIKTLIRPYIMLFRTKLRKKTLLQIRKMRLLYSTGLKRLRNFIYDT